MSQNAAFVTGSLLRHITVMSVTASVGLLALFLVDLVDMLFISMLGNAQLAAAVGYAGSILFFTTSAGIGLSIAAGSLIAKSLGQDDPDRAREYLTHVTMVGAAFSILFAGAIWFNLDALTALVGASGDAQEFAVSYLKIIIPTMPIMMVGMVGAAALRSHGAAKISTIATLSAGIVNAVLDPLFIFTFDMGLQGAAWASAVARLAMAIAAFWPLITRFGGFGTISIPAVAQDMRPILLIAIPAILANVASPVGAAYVTRVASDFGQEAVAGMAVISRLTPISFALIFAMSGAIGPIIGQNFGAKKFNRVSEAYRDSLIFIVIYVVIVVAILFMLRGFIVDLFGVQGVGRDLIFLFCGPLSLAWIFNGVLFVGNASFNNLGHPFYSTWINWGRNTIGMIPFVYFGAQIWGAQGVLIGQMAGGAFVALISLWLARRVMTVAEGIEHDTAKKHRFHEHHRDFKIWNHRR